MSETTTKRPRATRIIILAESGQDADGDTLWGMLPGSYSTRKAAQAALVNEAPTAGVYAIAAVLWRGEVAVETKTVATLKTAGAEPKKTRTRKPSAYAKAEKLLDEAALKAAMKPVLDWQESVSKKDTLAALSVNRDSVGHFAYLISAGRVGVELWSEHESLIAEPLTFGNLADAKNEAESRERIIRAALKAEPATSGSTT